MKKRQSKASAAIPAAAIQERHSMANTKLLQLKPQVLRNKFAVCVFSSNDNISDAEKIPYDFIAIGANAALKLAKIGAKVVAVYLNDETDLDALPPELLIGLNHIPEEDDIISHNIISVGDDFPINYSHIDGDKFTNDSIPIGVKRLAGLLGYKSIVDTTFTVPKFKMITQLWKPNQSRRWKELCIALRKNAENPYINSIHVLLEEARCKEAWSDWPEELVQKLVPQLWKSRLTYKDAMEFACTNMTNDDILCISNADIFFKNEVREVWNVDMKDRCLALLRYEVTADWAIGRPGAEEPKIYGPRDDSQDCWIFSVKSLKERLLGQEDWSSLDFTLGRAGCDNCFAGELTRRRWLVSNPVFTIKSFHLHESPERTWRQDDMVTRGVYATLAPSGLMESRLLRPSDFEVIKKLEVEETKKVTVIPSWCGGVDNAPYERGLAALNAGSSTSVLASESDTNNKKNISILRSTYGTIITPEGLLVKGDGIGFGSDGDYAEALWSQTSYTMLSPTIPVKTSVFLPQLGITEGVLGRVFEAGRVGWLAAAADQEQPTICLPPPNLKTFLDLLEVRQDISGKPLLVTENSIGLLPDSSHTTLLEPAIKYLREKFHPILFKDLPSTGAYSFFGIDYDICTEYESIFHQKYEKEPPTNVLGRSVAPLKTLRILTESSVIILDSVSNPDLRWGLWACRPGTTIIDLNPSLTTARIATASGLQYAPLRFDGESTEDRARIIMTCIDSLEKEDDPLARPKLPIIYVPSAKEGYHGHPGDSFREMVELWAEAGWVERRWHDGVFCWLHAIGEEGVLLYDRDTKEWLESSSVPAGEKKWKKMLCGNELVEGGTPWFYWARRPRLLERLRWRYIEKPRGRMMLIPRKARGDSAGLVFYGKIENSRQFKNRAAKATGLDWSSVCDEFEMPVGGKYKYTQEEYLEKMTESRFGLCLPGYGPKCHREIECMGLGVVPIVTPGIDMTNYAVPPIEGVHYLRASTPEEAAAIVKDVTGEKWKEMCLACLKYYYDHLSPEAAWKLTKELADCA